MQNVVYRLQLSYLNQSQETNISVFLCHGAR